MTQAEAKVTRLFDAPVDVVWAAWTDPAKLRRWWGVTGFTNPECEADVRPGGAFRIHQTGPDGATYRTLGTYEEVVPRERLVLLMEVFEADAAEPALRDRTTVTFVDRDGKTELVVHGTIVWTAPGVEMPSEGLEEGWDRCFDRLASLLAGDEPA